MWQSGAGSYDRGFGPLTSQAAAPLLNAALGTDGLVDGRARTRLLDVATGPGFVADAAAERGCEVVALDFSSEMLELAKPLAAKHAGRLTLQQGDAQALPLADGSFDAVVVAFGVLHLPRPMECLREAYRVLRPGGRIAFSVWDVPQPGSGFAVVLDALAAHGDPNVPLPGGEGVLPFFHFADDAASADALADAGFARDSCCSTRLPLAARLAAADDLYSMLATGTARTRAILERQTDGQRSAIRTAMAKGVQLHATAGGGGSGGGAFVVPMPAVCVTAQKPGYAPD